ncbi:WD40/YVTN repeat-like-containing domain protein [Vibrio phage 2.095.A._10N.286.46.E10]|nr:WD40/YVTN repeat-like-containing domain protein [Vibrio phage 2.095.A._10N.286.46.E10]AUS02197.1 WD40/YVTN repeat-like-containing domain protein [Vibrio phage 2.095.B._10N.286.46.E10]
MTLKVVDPINITEAVLTASDIPEPDASVGEVEWQDPTILGRFGNLPDVQYAVALGSDGFLYSFGRAGAVVKIDPDTSTMTTFGSYNVGRVYAAALAGDGNIYAVGSGGTVLKLEVSTQTLSTFGSYPGTCESATLAPNGDIYCVSTNGFVLKIDVSAQSVSQFGSYGSGYKTSSLGGDGNIYCAGLQGDVLKIDVNEQTVSTFGSVTGKYYGSATGVDGNVYCVGYSGNVLKINVSNQSVSTFGSCVGAFESAALDGNGRIKCVASSSTTSNGDILEIDTASESIYRFGSYTDDFFSIALAPNGKMFAVGNNVGGSTGVIEILDTYSPGDRVILESEHLVYQCLSVTYQNPKDGATDDAAATWIVVGPTNKWAMFDGLQNTKTSNSTDFTVTLKPVTYVNTLAMFGFSGVESLRIEVDNSLDVNIYDKTYSMSDFSAIYDHYTYVFYQIASLDDFIATDLPPLPNTTIRVTFSGSAMKIGELVTGFAIDIGQLVAENTKSDRFRYREQAYNEFGYPTGNAPIVVELNTYDVLVPKLNNQAIQKLLDTLTGENTLWFGDIGGGQSLVTYGFFERSPIPYAMPNHINYQITVRASV